MRPHRDSTPILLVCVSLLFVLVAVLKFRDLASGETPARRWDPGPAGNSFEPVGARALLQAEEAVVPRFNHPGDSVFAAFRSPAAGPGRSVAFSIPVSATPSPESEAILRAGRVQGELLRGPPFLQGDLPHSGTVRLEATVVHQGESVWRSWSERDYRLVRLGLPHPLGEHSLLVLDPSGLLDGESDGEMTAARADQEAARTNLASLRASRVRLTGQAHTVARRLVDFIHGFRHIGGDGGGVPPEAITAAWLAALPTLPDDPPNILPRYHPEQVLATGWKSTDLTYWGGFRQWSQRLRKAREEARLDYHRTWSAWGNVVRDIFVQTRWEQLRTGDELAAQVAADRARIGRALTEVMHSATVWAGYEVQLLQHYGNPFQFFQTLEDDRYLEIAEAMRLLRPMSWQAQAFKRFVGEDAAARCGRFLEGVSGPFAKDFKGVVYVDNNGGPALEIAEATFPGRLVLVTTGDVRLSNLGPRDSSKNRLIVQAGGRLEISGRVRAFLVAQGGIRMAPNSLVVGGLVLSTLDSDDVLAGRVNWDPAARLEDQLEDLQVVLGAASEEASN